MVTVRKQQLRREKPWENPTGYVHHEESKDMGDHLRFGPLKFEVKAYTVYTPFLETPNLCSVPA